MTPEESRGLVDAARAGDRDALERLLAHHYDAIHALCRRLTGSAHDADDATQETLLGIVRGLERFDGRSAVSTWIYRIATNACLDELRRRKRRPVARDEVVTEPTASFEAAVADRDELDRLLGALPEEFRAAVTLRDLCGLDYAEIAEVLDVPIGTVRSRLARGRRALLDLGTGNFSPTPDVEQSDP